MLRLIPNYLYAQNELNWSKIRFKEIKMTVLSSNIDVITDERSI